jgi:hypothetical protein
MPSPVSVSLPERRASSRRYCFISAGSRTLRRPRTPVIVTDLTLDGLSVVLPHSIDVGECILLEPRSPWPQLVLKAKVVWVKPDELEEGVWCAGCTLEEILSPDAKANLAYATLLRTPTL